MPLILRYIYVFGLISNKLLKTLNEKSKNAVYHVYLQVAFLVNYFWLCQLFWMVAEATVLYLAIIVVRESALKRPILTFNLICWLIPAIFPAIGIAWGGERFADPTT